MTSTLSLTLKSILSLMNIFHLINLKQFDPLSPNLQQTCTMVGERTLFNMSHLDFSTLNTILSMKNLVCTIVLQQIDALSLNSHQICNMAADSTPFNINDLDLGSDFDLNTFND